MPEITNTVKPLKDASFGGDERTAQQRILPTAAQPRLMGVGFESDITSSSISVADGESVTNQISVTDNSGYQIVCLTQRATYVGDTSTLDNLLPQLPQGGVASNVGPDESDYLVIGPYDALFPSDSSDPVPVNRYVNQLFVRNNSGGVVTLIFQAKVRIVRTNPPPVGLT